MQKQSYRSITTLDVKDLNQGAKPRSTDDEALSGTASGSASQ